jgi:hypothetical protein
VAEVTEIWLAGLTKEQVDHKGHEGHKGERAKTKRMYEEAWFIHSVSAAMPEQDLL